MEQLSNDELVNALRIRLKEAEKLKPAPPAPEPMVSHFDPSSDWGGKELLWFAIMVLGILACPIIHALFR